MRCLNSWLQRQFHHRTAPGGFETDEGGADGQARARGKGFHLVSAGWFVAIT